MNTKLIKTFASIAALMGLATSLPAITIGNIVNVGETGEIGGVDFTVDFGSVSYVSDLSNGALRFGGSSNSPSTSILTEELNIIGDTELSFDWTAADRSDNKDFSFYQIEGLDSGISIFHDGIGMGNSSGTVSRFLTTGDYMLRVTAAVAFNPELYQLTVGNLRLNPLDTNNIPDQGVPPGSVTGVADSSLGFLGIATIFAVMGAHRRFLKKATA